jgi:hypothetical protein
MRRRFVAVVACAAAAALAPAQFSPDQEYQQFRAGSGLPGGGLAVAPNGQPGLRGALTYNVPVAYGYEPRRIGGVGGNLSRDQWLRWPDTDGRESQGLGNGTAWFIGGLAIGRYRITPSYMVLSGQLDAVFNFHVEVPTEYYGIRFAGGVQDLFGNGGKFAENFPGDRDYSGSFYAVATRQFGDDVFATAGIGTGRFRRGFVAGSARLAEYAKAFAEYDGYAFNYGLGLGYGNFVGTLGYGQGVHAFFTLGLTISLKPTTGNDLETVRF